MDIKCSKYVLYFVNTTKKAPFFVTELFKYAKYKVF